MKILLLGSDGQVGWELRRALAPLGTVTALDRDGADFEDIPRLRETVRKLGPRVIVNAAAYTAVDQAEKEPERARRINAEAVAALAEEARAAAAWLVHYSTDYVFAGDKPAPYVEDDPTGPLSVYGATKLAGEIAIREAGCNHLIFRTSWVFAARGANFAKTMLRLAGERERLRVIADQIGAPTAAELIADVTALCLYRLRLDPERSPALSGTYHLVAGGLASWHDYARFVIAEARRMGRPIRVADAAIEAIASEEYPLPAARPKNSRLNTDKLTRSFGIALPDWSLHVRRMLAEICAKEGQ